MKWAADNVRLAAHWLLSLANTEYSFEEFDLAESLFINAVSYFWNLTMDLST